jgi:hypothetical protein
MRFDLIFHSFVGALLILLMLLMARFWCVDKSAPAVPKPPKRKREPKPFAGYIQKPECEWCEQQVQSPPQALTAPPPRMKFTRGRRRQVDTTGHFCPYVTCSYSVVLQR